MNLAIAYAEIDGPWWGRREEIYHAQTAQTVMASVGCARPLSAFLVDWSQRGPIVMEFNDGIHALAAAFGVSVQ